MASQGFRNRLLRAGAIVGAAGLMVATSGVASAHVSATPQKTAAGSYSVVTLAIPHGCEDSATTRVTITMPEDVLTTIPTRNAYWSLAAKKEKLDTPVKSAHGEITERVSEVSYTAKEPLPSPVRDTFEIQIKVPDKPGETLYFPTLQVCEKGSVNWNEVPAAGVDPHSLKHPAPSFTITSAAGDGHDHGTTAVVVKDGKDAKDGHDHDHGDTKDSEKSSAAADAKDKLTGAAAGAAAADKKSDSEEQKKADDPREQLLSQAENNSIGSFAGWIPIVLAIIALGAAVYFAVRRRS